MSVLYVFLAITVVLGLVAAQMFVLRHKGMAYAAASLEVRALRPQVLVRTLLAGFVSTAYVVVCCILCPPHAPVHWAVFCVPTLVFFFAVPLAPPWLIAAFGTATARLIWSLVFGVSSWLIVVVFLEFLGFYSSGAFS